MDGLISSMQKQMEVLENRAKSSNDSNISQIESQIVQDLNNFQNSILGLTKACLTDLQVKNDKLVEMTGTVQGIEGSMNVIKESQGIAFRPTLPTSYLEPGIPELDIPSEKPEVIYLPSDNFKISLHVLDNLGPPLKDLQNPDSSPSLIRLVPANIPMPVLWTKQADYFLMNPERNPALTMTSFSEVYGIPSPKP